MNDHDPQQPTLLPDLQPTEPAPDLSAGRRLTLRQRADVDRGIHPLTGEPTRPDLGTCGTCAHRSPAGSAHGYPKCHRPDPANTGNLRSHSARTDVRAWWPACPTHTPTSDSLSDSHSDSPDPPSSPKSQ